MATSQRPLNILPANSGYCAQYCAGMFQTTDGASSKIHLKTNIPKAFPGYMVNVEAVGFSYGTAQAIRCSWSFYQWNSTLYSVGLETVYPGLTPEAVYYSTDNFVCLRGGTSSTYFIGFALNVYCASGDGAGNPVIFTNIVSNNVTGNHF